MEYFNKIINKKTNHKYRFKTREEFENEYGYGWVNTIKRGWYDDDIEGMNYLFGTDLDFLPLEEIEDIIKYNYTGYCDNYRGVWSISRDMIIKNEQLDFKNIYPNNSKRNIYENIITKFNNFK